MPWPLSAWEIWGLISLLAAGLEVAVSGLVLIWPAVGAGAAALIALFGGTFNHQLTAFSAVSLVLFAASRTLFRRALMRGGWAVRTGSQAMLDSEAVVTEAVHEGQGGTVRINGELWAARTPQGSIGPGERVRVERVDGLKLWVRRF